MAGKPKTEESAVKKGPVCYIVFIASGHHCTAQQIRVTPTSVTALLAGRNDCLLDLQWGHQQTAG